MTRINIIPPKELYDQHLIAEYREITMVPAALNRTLNSKNGLNKAKIPKQYTLNKGHVYFFYDKGKYLSKRYNSIRNEMISRGMKPDETRIFKREQRPDELYNDWLRANKLQNQEDQIEAKDKIRKRIKDWDDAYGHISPMEVDGDMLVYVIKRLQREKRKEMKEEEEKNRRFRY